MTAVGDGLRGVRHLVGDVQRFGLLSAATVVERYLEVVDRAMAEVSPASPPLASWGRDIAAQRGDIAAQGHDIGRLAEGTARMAEAWLRMLDATAALIPAVAPPGGDLLVLPATRPGGSSEASLWVHNPTDSPVAAVALHATSLASANGAGLPADTVCFTPAGLGLVEAGSSREVRVTVRVPPGQSPGQYHALLLTSAAPDEPIGLRLEVATGHEGGEARDVRWG